MTEAMKNGDEKAKSQGGGRTFLILLLLASAAGGGWYALNQGKKEEITAPRREGPVRVQTALVEKGEADIAYSALGTVTPLANVTVKTQIAGKIMSVGFQEGQTVKEGDFLAQIDPRPYENALADAEGQLAKDQALLREAELNLARYQKLVAQDSLAKQQLDTQESLVQQYKGTVQSDEAALATARLNLTYCKIVSPIAGRAGLRLTDPGNYVQVSDSTGIVTIAQMQPISVLFTLPEDTVPALQKRLKAEEPIVIDVYDRAQTQKLASGTLASVNNQIDSTTGTIKLRATFANEDTSLFPNQFVNVRLVLDTLHDATLVSSSAIQQGTVGSFVYVADGAKAQMRPVKTGVDNGKKTVVTEGLQPGDAVIVDGIDKLRDGAEIVASPVQK